MVASAGSSAGTRLSGRCASAMRAKLLVEHAGMRLPIDLTVPRAWLTRSVRARTIASRVRRTARWAWASSPRCLMGASILGSKRPSRASDSASVRSVFLGWLWISASMRAFATTHWCPSSSSSLLIHGEWGPRLHDYALPLGTSEDGPQRCRRGADTPLGFRFVPRGKRDVGAVAVAHVQASG